MQSLIGSRLVHVNNQSIILVTEVFVSVEGDIVLQVSDGHDVFEIYAEDVAGTYDVIPALLS